MAEKSIQQAATDRAATRSHLVRRVVLTLAAVVVLGWGRWFVRLVAVEMRVERFLSGTPTIPIELIEKPESIAELTAALESVSGVAIVIDWHRFPRRDEPWTFGRGDVTKFNGDDMVSFIGSNLPANRGREMMFDPEDRIMYSRSPGRPFATVEAVWYIEGNAVVITTPERVPRFDASAKARQWWHAMEAWWEGGP